MFSVRARGPALRLCLFGFPVLLHLFPSLRHIFKSYKCEPLQFAVTLPVTQNTDVNLRYVRTAAVLVHLTIEVTRHDGEEYVSRQSEQETTLVRLPIGSNPPIRALYMQLAEIPPIHHTTPCATIAPGADKPARYPPRARAQQVPAQLPSNYKPCLLYTSPSPRDRQKSRMPSSA